MHHLLTQQPAVVHFAALMQLLLLAPLIHALLIQLADLLLFLFIQVGFGLRS